MRLAVVVAVALGMMQVARAEPHAPSAKLKREFDAGVDAFRLGKLDEARAHLEKARALDPKLPGPHRFLAAVARAGGDWQACIDSARLALALNPSSAEVAETRTVHDDCRAGAGRAPYRGELARRAAIAVTANIAGATVKIRGLTFGSTPLDPRPIAPGSLEIEIAKPGWTAVRMTIDAPVGIVTDVHAELVKAD